MAKKPYRRNNQKQPNEVRCNMISICRKEYDALIQHRTELDIICRYLQKETSVYVDADTLRLILGIKKEDQQ